VAVLTGCRDPAAWPKPSGVAVIHSAASQPKSSIPRSLATLSTAKPPSRDGMRFSNRLLITAIASFLIAVPDLVEMMQ
jgi:hypothetical protein